MNVQILQSSVKCLLWMVCVFDWNLYSF